MKKAILFLITASIFDIHGFAQAVVATKTGPPGLWQELGVINVDFKLTHDDIVLTGPAEFRSLKFKVFDAPVKILNLNVIFQNGKVDQMNLKYVVPPGGESKVIDLKFKHDVKDAEKRIRRVTVWYQSVNKGNQGKARLELWGMK